MTARLVPAEVGSARLGELAAGEQVMLLKRAESMRPVRSAYVNFVMPMLLILVLYVLWRSLSAGGGWIVDLFVWFAAGAFGLTVLVQWVQAGWLPAVYSLEWSPRGLSARWLWRSDVIPPGTEITVRIAMHSTSVRSPAGRWYPVPGEVFDLIVERRGGEE
ncbi:MAG: hypothetical protein LAT64_08865 [Phycisphaerales bacterium]|nr:hypothetical protein [Planctomycetota bacterium]MCH8508861.1 hypothetical protein [Phycisphaerales bacterium]